MEEAPCPASKQAAEERHWSMDTVLVRTMERLIDAAHEQLIPSLAPPREVPSSAEVGSKLLQSYRVCNPS